MPVLILLKNIDNSSQITITNHIYVENLIDTDEPNMQFSVGLDLVSIWMDTRLAYSDSITTKSSLDATSYISDIWHPQIQITDNVKDNDILTETMTLYKNGTVSYTKRLILDLKCTFDYSSMPKDHHICHFIFFPLNYDSSKIKLVIGNRK